MVSLSQCFPWLFLLLTTSSSILVDRKTMQDFFQCPPCNKDRCLLPDDPCELVLEPGICGCCPVCARGQGESCGVKIGRCSEGLKCRPLPGESNPLLALFNGRAACIGRSPYAILFQEHFVKGE